MASEMTSKERVMAALYGKEFDVFPAVSLTSVANLEGMKCSGAFYPEAHLDGAKMAALAAVGHSHMNFDTVAPYFSILLEASALGSEIDWGDGVRFPFVRRTAFRKIEDISICPNYMEKTELQQLLRADRKSVV